MTDQRPHRCDYDPTTRTRVTRNGDPCNHDHCVLCRARHTDNSHPLVCPVCVGGIREDLHTAATSYAQLRTQAIHGAPAGRLLAAAPIPGGQPLVLLGPAGDRETARNRWDSATAGRLTKSKLWAHYADDHRTADLEPPLSLLAAWEDLWRQHLQTTTQRRASVASAVKYLDEHLTLMAQLVDGPDITVFARDIAGLRARLDTVLHDEHTPERGVECFECGVRLVRRIADPRRCDCGPRPVRRHAEHGPCTCPARLRLDLNAEGAIVPVQVRDRDPDDGHIHPRRDLSCIACHIEAEWEARHARHGQGGVADPRPGFSWECPGCRKKYTPGEYARAVRQDLATQHEDEDGRQLGWTTVPIAAAAAAEQTGRPITANTIRTWAARAVEREARCAHPTKARRWLEVLESYPEAGGPWPVEVAAAAAPCPACTDPGIGTVCFWAPGRRFGVQLVFWPDVADRISATRKGGRPKKVAS